MTGPRYRIKLYGQSGDDPVAFKRSLAAVLAIDPEKAEDLLRLVPVTIKEDISFQEAERLRNIIGIFKGLCIVEPMDGALPEAVLPALRIETPATLTERLFAPQNRATFMVAAGGALLAFFFLAAFALTPKVAVRDREALTIFGRDRVRTGPLKSKPAAETQYQGMTEQDLDREYTALESETPQLKDELADLEQQLHKATNRAAPTDREVGDLTVRSLTARDEFRAKLKRLQAVKRRLNTLRFEDSLRTGPGSEE